MSTDSTKYFLKKHKLTEEIVDGRPMCVFDNRPKSLRDMLDDTATKYPNREGFVDANNRWTFSEFSLKVKKLATVLRTRLLVKKGDRVAILMETGVPYTLGLFSIADAGAIAVPLNSRFTIEELAYEIENSGSDTIMLDEVFADIFMENRKYFKFLNHILLWGKRDNSTLIQLEELIDSSPYNRLDPVPISEDDLVMIMYTSGTTGFPKGAMQTHRGVIHACMLIDDLFEPVAGDRLLNALPMFHSAGTIMSSFSAVYMGIPCVYLPKYKTDIVLQTIEKEKITLMVHVPTVYWFIATHKDLENYDLSSLRAGVVGGAPKSRETFQFIMKKLSGVRFSDTYGLTETHSMDFVLTHDEMATHMDSVGRPVPVTEMQIVSKNRTQCISGEAGEICLRGPKIIKGYWKNLTATQESIQDGWLLTGDVGKVDDQGYIYLLDRIKDMINRGGENIYSVEVEKAIRRHPSVEDAAVVGIPDAVFGEEVKAYVSLKTKTVVTKEDIREHCKLVLADYKIPKIVEIVADFPRNSTGKIIKSELRKRG